MGGVPLAQLFGQQQQGGQLNQLQELLASVLGHSAPMQGPPSIHGFGPGGAVTFPKPPVVPPLSDGIQLRHEGLPASPFHHERMSPRPDAALGLDHRIGGGGPVHSPEGLGSGGMHTDFLQLLGGGSNTNMLNKVARARAIAGVLKHMRSIQSPRTNSGHLQAY